MLRCSEHQYSAEYVFVDDIVLYVIRVMLHAESKQLYDQSKQLTRLEIIWQDKHTKWEVCRDHVFKNRYAKCQLRWFKKAAYTFSLHASYKLAKMYYLCWVFLLWCWQEAEQRAHACNAYKRNSRTQSSRFSARNQTEQAHFATFWQKTMKKVLCIKYILILTHVSH